MGLNAQPGQWDILRRVVSPPGAEGIEPGAIDLQLLAESLLANPNQVKGFGITPETVDAVVERRLQGLRSVYPILTEFCCKTLGWQTCPLSLVWELWLPLALQMADWQTALGQPLIQGILGGQGTGKTTLTAILAQILMHWGYPVCRLSIDDLYKPYAERQQLQQSDPRFSWRGPPGTHDVELGLQVLQQLRNPLAQPVAVPRFDKSAQGGAGDRTTPEWVTGAKIILFEGWFVGVRPIDPSAFDLAPPPIVTEADRAFAREVNTRLQDYVPLWEMLDRLILLYPTDYRLSQQWRQQAEQQMIAGGKSGMAKAEINQFVEYFWKSLHPELFIQPLCRDSTQVDLVIELDPDHLPTCLYRP